MENIWGLELVDAVDGAPDAQALFAVIDGAAKTLGFEHCAFGMRLALPVSRPRTFLISSQPAPWQARYAAESYLASDPTVRRGALCEAPQIWSDELFCQARTLWDEARSAGLRHGLAQSSLDAPGLGSMLTVSRGSEPITAAEITEKLVRIQQLGHMAHVAFQRLLAGRAEQVVELTEWS